MVKVELRCPDCKVKVQHLTTETSETGIREILKGVWYCPRCNSIFNMKINKITQVESTRHLNEESQSYEQIKE